MYIKDLSLAKIHFPILVTLISLIFLLACSSCSEENKKTLNKVRFGIVNQPSSALIHVALDQGYFKQEYLDIIPSYFPSGKRALVNGLLKNKVDYITAADIPFAWKSFEHKDLRVLASIYNADNTNSIIARKDAGIETLKDLKGKHIATQKQSAVHYFMHLVLNEQGLSNEDVTISFFKAEQLPVKLAAGEIDAFSMREPYISQAIGKLGADNSLVFSLPGLYIQDDLLVTNRQQLERQPEVSRSILRALIKAEEFVRQQPEQAKTIVARQLKIEPQKINSVWNTFTLSVGLEHPLLLRLERQASWMIEEKLTSLKSVPNFRKRIESNALESVKPDAMLMIQ